MANAEEAGVNVMDVQKDEHSVDLREQRFYALYEYRANRPSNKESNDGSSDGSLLTELLQKDLTLNGDFSLSSMLTSLSPESEAELRKFMGKRLSRGSLYSGTGSIAVIDFGLSADSESPSACYYCLLRPVDLEGETQSEAGVCSKDYVVCFITHAEDGALDLFRAELDQYSENLLEMLSSERKPEGVFLDVASDCVPEIKTEDYLSNWYTHCVEYVSRCVTTVGTDLCYLINIAMNNWDVTVEGGGDLLQADIKKFVDCCSLSEILKNTQTPMEKVVDDLLLVDFSTEVEPSEADKYTVTMTIVKDGFQFSNKECTTFCKSWSEALCKANSQSSVQLRQIVENYRQQQINYMNELNRLIRQAEKDFYALYRAYTFLKTCGNGVILLRHAKLDHTTMSADAKEVLKVLEEYIEETEALS